MVSVFSSLLMFVGIGLILFHAYIMFKNQNKQERDETINMLNLFGKSLNGTSSNVTQPIKVSAVGESTPTTPLTSDSTYMNQIFKLCSLISIAMTLFDGNYHILLVKNEMQKPEDFTKVAVSSMTTYTIMCFAVGFFSYIGMGSKLMSPVTENVSGDYQILGSKAFMLDSNAIYYLKWISILCMFASCFLYSMSVFISL